MVKGSEFIRMLIFVLSAIVGLGVIFGCQTTSEGDGYKFGNLTRAYCSSTDLAFRKTIRTTLQGAGVHVPIDYCLTYGLADALVKSVENKGE